MKLFLIEKVLAQFTDDQGQPGFSGNQGDPISNPLGSINSISALITKILEIVVQIGLPAIALAIVYTGFLFVKARGNETELTQAKTTLFWTVIGAAVILGAFVIKTAICGTVTNLGGNNVCS
ncbi:MAG: hypothetical protein HYT47_01450 [Candidatus Vogelbacteria bacterium]|nr:hypothetical protein [Candidatus Vogelbacteria bacterium]